MFGKTNICQDTDGAAMHYGARTFFTAYRVMQVH